MPSTGAADASKDDQVTPLHRKGLGQDLGEDYSNALCRLGARLKRLAPSKPEAFAPDLG